MHVVGSVSSRTRNIVIDRASRPAARGHPGSLALYSSSSDESLPSEDETAFLAFLAAFSSFLSFLALFFSSLASSLRWEFRWGVGRGRELQVQRMHGQRVVPRATVATGHIFMQFAA